MTGLVTRPPTELALPLQKALQDAAGLAQQALAPETLRAYRHDFQAFAAWCTAMGVPEQALPTTAAILAAYVSHRYYDDGCKVPTLVRLVSAVVHQHTTAGLNTPAGAALKLTLKGIRRHSARKGVLPNRKAPTRADDLLRAIQVQGGELIDLRDRALLLVGFAGAFRRSELVRLNVEDVRFEAKKGYRLFLPYSKTDQAGEGYWKGIPYGENPDTCPVLALQAWLQAAQLAEGPIFMGVNRHGRKTKKRLNPGEVARIVKKHMARIGKSAKDFSGHSLRAGLVTEAYAAGKSTKVIMDQTGHKSHDTLYRYIRLAEMFRDNAASGIGL